MGTQRSERGSSSAGGGVVTLREAEFVLSQGRMA